MPRSILAAPRKTLAAILGIMKVTVFLQLWVYPFDSNSKRPNKLPWFYCLNPLCDIQNFSMCRWMIPKKCPFSHCHVSGYNNPILYTFLCLFVFMSVDILMKCIYTFVELIKLLHFPVKCFAFKLNQFIITISPSIFWQNASWRKVEIKILNDNVNELPIFYISFTLTIYQW